MRDKRRLLDGRAGLARATGVHEPPQRDRIEKHGERHARQWSAHGSERHPSCDGPWDEPRHQHHRVLNVERMVGGALIELAAQLMRHHDGERLVARDHRDSHGDHEGGCKGCQTGSERSHHPFGAFKQVGFGEDARVGGGNAHDFHR